ncbi:putative mitochondrial protein [Glycine soja]
MVTHLLLEVASSLSLPSPFRCHSSSKKQRNPLMKKILGLQAPMELTSCVKNLTTIIEGAIVHILNITPKEEKRIEGLNSLPYFHGKDNVEAYLDWEMKVEQLFACHHISEERKVPLATLSFQGIHRDPPVEYWNDLKSALRKRHIPSYYERELMDKLQRLRQGSMSIEEYRQQMELLLLRAGLREEERTTIARFLSGLNIEVRDKVELLPYRDLDELVQLCIRVEQQLKRKPSSKSYGSHSYPRKDQAHGILRAAPSKPKEDKGKTIEKYTPKTSSQERTCNIKCFKCLGRGHIASQCPTKKTMIMRGQDIYSSQEETTSCPSSSGSEDEVRGEESSEEVYPHEEVDLLMVRRLLGGQSYDLSQSQRENIFHTRCKILDKTCSLIMDNGSCCNCCSTRLVSKLNLTIIPHPKPYKLQWLNEQGEMIVNQQVKVPFSIGTYKDEVNCDIVLMEGGHILLGRPWQFDRKIIYNGLTNEITLTHLDTKFVLHPQTPSQVAKDQLTMKDKRDEEEKLEKQKKKKDSKALSSKAKGKGKEESDSSKKIVKKENHFATKSDIKRALLLKQSFYLLLSREKSLSTAIPLELEVIPQVKELLDEGLVCKSLNPCALLVPKICIIRHQIPMIGGMMNMLSGATLFCKITHAPNIFIVCVHRDSVGRNNQHENKEKCMFYSITFLKFLNSDQGLPMDPKRIKVILEWPTPPSIREIWGFNILANFYKRFVPYFFILVAPLIEWVRNYILSWKGVFSPYRVEERIHEFQEPLDLRALLEHKIVLFSPSPFIHLLLSPSSYPWPPMVTHLLLEVASPLSLPSPFRCHSSSKKQRNPLMKKILGLQAPM